MISLFSVQKEKNSSSQKKKNQTTAEELPEIHTARFEVVKNKNTSKKSVCEYLHGLFLTNWVVIFQIIIKRSSGNIFWYITLY